MKKKEDLKVISYLKKTKLFKEEKGILFYEDYIRTTKATYP
jgi:hypothetical protein